MSKTILLTGATDGLGLRAAELIVEQGHIVILHGRRVDRLADLHGICLQRAMSRAIAVIYLI